MQKFLPVPQTLRDIGLMVQDHGADYSAMVKEFIDSVLGDLRAKGAHASDIVLPIDPSVYADEPPPLANRLHRAHLAGLAEYMANLSAQPVPGWTGQPQYFLDEPVFMGGAAMRNRVMAETPAGFRKRLLFTGPALAKIFAMLPQ